MVALGLMAAGAAISAPAASAAVSTAAPADATEMTSLEKQAFDNVNAQRTANGYAAEMVTTHNFSHTSTSGKSPSDRAQDAG